MGLLRVLFVLTNNIYCIPTYAMWMLSFYPLTFFSPDLYWYIEGRLFHWLLSMVSLWSYTAGYNSKFNFQVHAI
jgi:lysophosphatidylglycerol acyltransferase 1